jgi:hypothetical protein
VDKSGFKKNLSRKQFEDLIAGDWVAKANGQYHENGDFRTAVLPGWKIFQGKNFTIRGKTWAEIAKIITQQQKSQDEEE